MFNEIGNLLGLFYIIDNSFRDIGYRGMARVLVDIGGWLEY